MPPTQTTAPNICRASATAVMSELSIPRDDGYMRAYAGPAKSDADAAVAREVRGELELASAVVMEYAPLPKFVPTHVTNFGSTTSRSVARRNHACAGLEQILHSSS